ncbi:acyloxyacyl hydrolase [Glaciecola sp. MH2013]|uniref:acyloxyacyl hydrolase n=1 Tax=Glaciecola sp. MH2013 TaxID=2785524 RepID=UPI0018A0EC22|nr:acyloxyacyl hydrolase [Glaciecola sp. MH2013]MBF7073622.1 acyloxyacyl hydrolase [Glaciecola sp. MH2013]
MRMRAASLFGGILIIGCYSAGASACSIKELKEMPWKLHSMSIRARFAEQTFLGDDAVEKFNALDTAVNFKLPCTIYQGDSWQLGTNLMLSAGILKTFDENAISLSAIPELMLRNNSESVTFNAGFGLAAFTRNKFGVQDFGGPVQFAITFGATTELTSRTRLGYRFQHYSDGRAYGTDTTGADLHMIEFYYQF